MTSPLLPGKEVFTKELEDIWSSRWLTNNGKFHQRLEERLSSYLGAPYPSLVSNGTLGLMLALKAFCPPGSEVITTPFSFIATAHAILWCGLIPVFCDIEPEGFGIDPAQIESHITSRTSAILPVHVYGYPCDVEKVDFIAEKYGLSVIYDAAHVFGVRYKGRPITEWGDASVLSFHATKLFNTMEGGAVFSKSEEAQKKINLLRNFGITSETTVEEIGMNAKLNEIQSLWGLLVLDEIDDELARRRELDTLYRNSLSGFEFISIPEIDPDVEWNYAYFPVLFGKAGQAARDAAYDALRAQGIYTRKYFYPLITQVESYASYRDSYTPVAKGISESVLCLPMYGDLGHDVVEHIQDVLWKMG